MRSPAALYSLRMRAALGGPHETGGRHVSGAERLVAAEGVAEAAALLFQRACCREIRPDFIRVTLDWVPLDQVERIPCLPVTTVTAPDPGTARAVAERLLEQAGVSLAASAAAFTALQGGRGPGGASLRGAALFDAHTGGRCDPEGSRGVRASHLDYSSAGRRAAQQALAEQGLTHFRIMEALAVASKVIWAGVLAEVCWSDEPDYLPGYVATQAAGYVRFPAFKPRGAAGGRVFFVSPSLQGTDVVLERLEQRCVLIEPPVVVRPSVAVEGFLQEAGIRARAPTRPDQANA